jgi:hypothetical protein
MSGVVDPDKAIELFQQNHVTPAFGFEHVSYR